MKDDQTPNAQFKPLVEQSLAPLFATGLFRAAPGLLVLDPAGRSRLRWLPEEPR